MIPTWGAAFGANAILNSAEFRADLTHSLVLDKGTGSPTYTRATTGTVSDNEGILRTAIAGEARFVGARRVRNLNPNSQAIGSWTLLAATVSSDAIVAPDGTTTADTILETVANSAHAAYNTITIGAGTHLYSVYLKRNGRDFAAVGVAGALAYFNLATGVVGTVSGVGSVSSTISDEGNGWYRCTLKITGVAGNQTTAIYCTIADNTTSYAGDITKGVHAWGAQLEDITGRTDQTTPSEYVSVGALDYRSTQDPLYLSLPGITGRNTATPDASARFDGATCEFIAKIAPTDWTPPVDMSIFAKDFIAGNQRCFNFGLHPTGALELYCTSNGSTIKTATSSVVNTFTNGTTHWVRCTYVAATGKVNFYTGEDGASWTALGVEQTIASGAFYSGTSILEIGSAVNGGSRVFTGGIFQVLGYNDNVLVIDYNPQRDAVTPTGTITSSTTGEVWTISGASSVIRNAAYHGLGVDGVKAFNTDLTGAAIPAATNLGYLAEAAAENKCLQSNAFTTTWSGTALSTLSQNAIGPDGGTTAWTLADTSGADVGRIAQGAITLTAAAYTVSVFVKKTSGATAFPLIWVVSAAYSFCTVDTNNGVATIWTSNDYGGTLAGGSARCTSYNSSFWRVEMTFTGTAAAYTLNISAAGTTNATQSTGVIDVTAQGSAVFYGAQVELGSAATSYIPTTTVAVTRNADVLTYPSAGNISDTVGTAYAEYMTTNATPANQTIVGGSTVNAQYITVGSPTDIRAYDGTGVRSLAGTPTGLVSHKTAVAYTGTALTGANDGSNLTTNNSFDGNFGLVAGGSPIAIGSVLGVQQANSTIRNVRIWQRALSSSELQAVTR